MTDFTAERWLPIAGYESLYEVSDFGRVKSLARTCRTRWGDTQRVVRERFLRFNVNPNGGHLIAVLCDDGTRSRRWVHRLVLEAFAGPKPPGLVTRHLDGDPTNNMLTNLKWGTEVENAEDTKRHGTNPKWTMTHCAKGHPFDEVNTYYYNGQRYCRECRRQHMRDYRKRTGH